MLPPWTQTLADLLLETAGVADAPRKRPLVGRLFELEEEGSSCLRLRGKAANHVDKDAAEEAQNAVPDEENLGLARELVRDGVATTPDENSVVHPLVFVEKPEPLLYLQRYYRAERKIVELMAQNHGRTGEQGDLAAMMRASRIAALVGGPGSGKTTKIAEYLTQMTDGERKKVLLMAPTARAAQRLQQSLVEKQVAGMDVRTVHRALGAGRQRFRYFSGRPLEADLVIVDEASMLDLRLSAALVDALPPEGRLLLVGDAGQLPAVGVGSMFGDLVDAGVAHVPLKTSYRFRAGSCIDNLATAIHGGDWNASLWNAEDDNVVLRWHPCGSPADVYKYVDAWLQKHGTRMVAGEDDSLEMLRQKLRAQRILCAVRDGAEGLQAIESRVGDWLRKQGELKSGAGEPWMVRVNDYGLGLFNGDLGFRRREGYVFPEKALAGDDTPRLYREIPSAERSFATTIHKAQGSEYQHVLVVLPLKENPLLSRELIYTAITRVKPAQDSPGKDGFGTVTVLGSENSLEAALKTQARKATGIAVLAG